MASPFDSPPLVCSSRAGQADITRLGSVSNARSRASVALSELILRSAAGDDGATRAAASAVIVVVVRGVAAAVVVGAEAMAHRVMPRSSGTMSPGAASMRPDGADPPPRARKTPPPPCGPELGEMAGHRLGSR